MFGECRRSIHVRRRQEERDQTVIRVRPVIYLVLICRHQSVQSRPVRAGPATPLVRPGGQSCEYWRPADLSPCI